MTIQHTVVFRLIHPAGSAAEEEFLVAAQAALAGIPGVEDFVVQRQINATSDLAWQLAMRFVDQSASAAYTAHPAHAAFVTTRWLPEVAEFQEYDFVQV